MLLEWRYHEASPRRDEEISNRNLKKNNIKKILFPFFFSFLFFPFFGLWNGNEMQWNMKEKENEGDKEKQEVGEKGDQGREKRLSDLNWHILPPSLCDSNIFVFVLGESSSFFKPKAGLFWLGLLCPSFGPIRILLRNVSWMFRGYSRLFRGLFVIHIFTRAMIH